MDSAPPETPAEVLRDVGRRVSELRVTQGLTQEALSERLGVNLQYLQRIEAGRENLTIRSIVHLAVTLGVRIATLFEPPQDRSPRGPGRPKRKPSA